MKTASSDIDIRTAAMRAALLTAGGRACAGGSWLTTVLLGCWIAATHQLQNASWLLVAAVLISAAISLFLWIAVQGQIEEERRMHGLNAGDANQVSKGD